MFHNTHSYIASKLYNDKNDLLLVGSILPDLALTRIFGWIHGGLHGEEEDKEFQEFINEHYPQYLDLAKGVHAHNLLDDFTHLDYNGPPGYAFRDNEKLISLLKEYYGIDDEWAKGKAHNLIEAAVDILLLKERPEVQNDLKTACNKIDRELISKILSERFNIDKEKTLDALNFYLNLFTKYDFSSQKEWVLFWQDLEPIMGLEGINTTQIETLFDEALAVVKKTYEPFLSFTLSHSLNT